MNSAIALWITDHKSTLFSILSWTSFSFIPICHRYSCQRKVFLFVKPSTSPNHNRMSCYTDYLISSKSIIKLSKLYLHVLFHCPVQEVIEMEQQQKRKKQIQYLRKQKSINILSNNGNKIYVSKIFN